jgi:hypothetical protein
MILWLHVVVVPTREPQQVDVDFWDFRLEPPELPSLIQDWVWLLLHRTDTGKTDWFGQVGIRVLLERGGFGLDAAIFAETLPSGHTDPGVLLGEILVPVHLEMVPFLFQIN